MKNFDYTLYRRYKFDGIPASRLNSLRHCYRKKFLKLIYKGQIRLIRCLECPCGSNNFLKIAAKDRFGLPFQNLICKQCGLLVLNPQISEISLSKYYNEIYHPLIVGTTHGSLLEDLVHERQGENIFNFVKDDLNKSTINVCEVGCAGGSNLKLFSEIAKTHAIRCNLYGSEYEDHYATKAKEIGLSITTESIESLSNFGVNFDIIILSHVLEHFTNIKKALKLFRNLLNNDGLLYIEVPGLMNLVSYNNDFINYLVHAHNYNFNLTSLKNLLALNGFKLLKGNEKVQALFIKGVNYTKEPLLDNNYKFILGYLKDTENIFIRRLSFKNYIKRFLWTQFYRLKYFLFLHKYMKKIIEFNI